jgi:hypothetical protein
MVAIISLLIFNFRHGLWWAEDLTCVLRGGCAVPGSTCSPSFFSRLRGRIPRRAWFVRRKANTALNRGFSDVVRSCDGITEVPDEKD